MLARFCGYFTFYVTLFSPFFLPLTLDFRSLFTRFLSLSLSHIITVEVFSEQQYTQKRSNSWKLSTNGFLRISYLWLVNVLDSKFNENENDDDDDDDDDRKVVSRNKKHTKNKWRESIAYAM